MGGDTIQLETAVSTISHEYLLEFTSEYGISEDLHPELPGLEERIVDFSGGWMSFSKRPVKNTPQRYTKPLDSLKNWNYRFFWVDERVFPTAVNWRTNAPKDEMPAANTYSRADVAVLNTRRTPIQKQLETLLCLVGLSATFDGHRKPVINMKDPDMSTESCRTPSAIEKSSLDFDNENPSPPMTEGKGTEDQAHETVAHEIPSGNMPATGAASEVSLEEDVATMRPRLSKKQDRRVNDEADANAPPKGVSDPDLLSYAEPQPHPEQSMTQVREIDLLLIHGWVTRMYLLARTRHDQQLPPKHPGRMQRCYRSHSAAGVRLLKKARAQIARRDQRIQVREKEIKKLDHEIQGLQNQTSNLMNLLEAEADMKKFAKAKNADLTKELESLRTQFLDLQVSNDQLTQQVSILQTQVTCEERIRADFEEFKKYEDDRVEKRCAEMDARLDALSIDFDEELYPHILTAITGRRWVIGHDLRLAVMKCAESIELRQAFANVCLRELPNALQELKDLMYPIENQLKGLKDAPMEVRDPKDPWAVKEEMLLEEAIAANVGRAEKKKSCQVVFRTHGVGSAHHVRSDGVPVSVPTVAP
nr:hypothetical protein [Tanacetum cinerariifolium]